LGLENFRLIRGHLTSEKCLENVSWLCREWDWLRGIDYESQKAKLEELDKDNDEKSREKVTKMVSVVSNIQERIPALERSHREMQQSLEHIMKTLQELNGKMTMK
jgi:predicted transcriptional regulator